MHSRLPFLWCCWRCLHRWFWTGDVALLKPARLVLHPKGHERLGPDRQNDRREMREFIALAPSAPGGRVPEELLEIRNMLATRVETWKRQWVQAGRQEGEAALLLRLLESRFGALPDWARDRITSADTAALEQWGLRLLDTESLDDILA